MAINPGIIVLMGSGELTATMVALHKELLSSYGDQVQAVFLDTPAGFQLNVDTISRKAGNYFTTRLGRPLSIASFKSAEQNNDIQAQKTFQALRCADYILIGPGSPTYALRQWRNSPVPRLLVENIEKGGCLVAASAAALTVGRFTLPVYEIYKVGQPLHWVEGLDILQRFGLNLVVVPHWNNAEGGNHDTRFCFMGESRFKQLEKLLPQPVDILGLDEHTALVIDLARESAVVKGVGQVTLRINGSDQGYTKGDTIALSVLRGQKRTRGHVRAEKAAPAGPEQPETLRQVPKDEAVWAHLHTLAEDCREKLARHQPERATGVLLEMERLIWRYQQVLQDSDAMGAARELVRELMVLFGNKLAALPAGRKVCLAPLVESLLALRARLRNKKQWQAADELRDCLGDAGIVIEDGVDGVVWRIRS